MNIRKILATLALGLAFSGTAWGAEYSYPISVTPTDWTALVSGTTFAAGDSINVTSSVNASSLTLTGVNDIAGTFNFAYGTGCDGLTYTLADSTAFASSYFRLTGNTTFNVTGGTVTMNAGFASNTTASAPYAFTKTGAGKLKLTLPDSKQYYVSGGGITGMLADIIVSEGTLELASATAGSPAIVGNTTNSITVKNGATLLVSASRAFGDYRGTLTLEDHSTVTFAAGINNNDFLTKTTVMGDGSKIDGAGYFSMRVTPKVVLNPNTSATISAGVYLMSDATFEIGEGSTLTFSGASSAYGNFDGKLIKTGAGTLIRSGISQNVSAVDVRAGTLEIAVTTTGSASGLGVGTNAVSVAAGANLLFSAERAAGWHSGSVTLAAKTDSLDGGKITFNSNDNSLAAANTLTMNDGSLLTGTGTWCFRSGSVTNADKTVSEVGGTLLLAGAGSEATVNVAAIAMYGATNNVIEVTEADSTLKIYSNISALQNGTSNFHEGLIVRGAGTVIFSNPHSSFSNALAVEGGTADLTNAHFFRQALNDYSQLKLSGGVTRIANLSNLGNLATAAGKVVFDGGVLEMTEAQTANYSDISSVFSYSGNGGGLIMASGSTITIDSALNSGGTMTLGGDGNYVIASTGSIGDFDATHPTSLLKSGSGSLTINRANTYSGATTLSGGATTLGVAGALPANTVLTVGDPANTPSTTNPASGATLQLGGFDLAVSKLSGDGGILNSGSVTSKLTINVPTGETSTYRGNYVETGTPSTAPKGISGKTEVHLAGGGKFISTGLNMFSGDLFIEDESWFVANAGTSGNETYSATGASTNTIHVGSGSTLEYAQSRAAGGGASVDLAENARLLVNSSDNSIAWGGSKQIAMRDGSLISGTGQIQFRGGSTIRLLGAGAAASVEGIQLFLREGNNFDVVEADSVLTVSARLYTTTTHTSNKKGLGTLLLTNPSHIASTQTVEGVQVPYVCSMNVQAGTLQIGNNDSTGVFRGNLAVKSGAALAFSHSTAAVLPTETLLTLEDGAALVNAGSANFTVEGTAATLTLPASGTLNFQAKNAGGDLILNGWNSPALSANVLAGSGVVQLTDSQLNAVSVAAGGTANFRNVDATSAAFTGTFGFRTANYSGATELDLTGEAIFNADSRIDVTGASWDAGVYDLVSANSMDLSNFTVNAATGEVIGLLSEASKNANWQLFLTGNKLQLSMNLGAVPEPAAFWLLLAGLGFALPLFRKRK